MSTGLIVAIIIVALIVVGLLVLMPRMRAKAAEKKAQRELESRRERVATEHREAASTRSTAAERAEQEAAIAQQNAQRERAEADRLEQQAQMHERGLADDELIEDHERDRFQNVTGDARGETADDARGTRADTEYEQGAEDEREGRFRQGDQTAAETEQPRR